MRTIAISRLVVSEAATIARRVTEALGYTLVNKSVLEGMFRQHGLTKFGDYIVPTKFVRPGKR